MLFLLAFERLCRNNCFTHPITSLRLVSGLPWAHGSRTTTPIFQMQKLNLLSTALSSTAFLLFNSTRNLINVLQKMELEAAFLIKEYSSPCFLVLDLREGDLRSLAEGVGKETKSLHKVK